MGVSHVYYSMMKNTNTDLLTQEYLDLIQKMTSEYFAKHYSNLQAPKYYVERGRKYHRVVQHDRGGSSSRSVHAFIGEDGMLYKAAGWKAPAKGVRYDLRLIEQREWLFENADWSGGYLYAK